MLGDGDKGTAMGEIMKRGYVLSHYAKYATGRKRIQIGKITNNANVNVTAYNGQNDLTLIFVNNGAIAVPSVKVNLPISVKSGDAVITSETQNMVAHNVSLGDNKQSVITSVPAKSIVSIKLIK
jgi:glucuronoarabinoxylan endo-1,4-beta-xylanase